MKVLFDSKIFDNQRYGGISRSFSELFKCFNDAPDFEYELPLRDTENEYLRQTYPFSARNLFRPNPWPKMNFKVQRLLRKIFNLIDSDSNINLTKRALKEQNFDIFHPTYYSTYFLKYLKDKPFVLTVYDMIYELYPNYFPADNGRTARIKKKLILRAAKIIAISENTKKDIINFYDIPAERIEVIYLANSLLPAGVKPANAPGLPARYILFVGSRGLYKNFLYFIQAISPLLRADRDLKVIVAGGYSGKDMFSKEEEKLFRELDIKDQVSQCSPSDEVLSYLYQQAVCFVFPSLYEGFGLPILEAFACNCPAVISKASSLPEIGGNAAKYFDPTDKNSILEAVAEVINDENLRQEMIARGKERLKKFSWAKTAAETLALYSSLLQSAAMKNKK